MLALNPTLSQSAPSAVRAPVVTMREATWKPGTTAPAYLDGSMPADAGCDPLCLAALALPPGVEEYSVAYPCKGSFLDRVCPFPWSIEERKAIMEQRTPEEVELTLNWMRAAELKHSRLAMLAVIGWPLAEILQSSLPFRALAFTDGRAPVLTNGLAAYTPFMLLVLGAAAYYELQSVDEVYQTFLSQPSKKYVPGDLGFDPLDLEAKFPSDLDQRTNEVYNGRLAMLAITGFCVQEGLWGRPVIDLPISGFFFGR
jgi:light-harvesting complex II chlorophyll a/b binding protein 4